MVTILSVQRTRHPISNEYQTLKYKIARLGLLGQLFFIAGIFCVLLALQMGGTKWAWSNIRIILLFIISLGSFIVFAVIQLCMGDDAGIPRRILKQRSIANGALFMYLLSAAFFTLIFYVSLPMHPLSYFSA